MAWLFLQFEQLCQGVFFKCYYQCSKPTNTFVISQTVLQLQCIVDGDVLLLTYIQVYKSLQKRCIFFLLLLSLWSFEISFERNSETFCVVVRPLFFGQKVMPIIFLCCRAMYVLPEFFSICMLERTKFQGCVKATNQKFIKQQFILIYAMNPLIPSHNILVLCWFDMLQVKSLVQTYRFECAVFAGWFSSFLER
eukprot:TRINITY_DN6137_c0_g2_i2.p2 TRINITY_DN6137_c0_g2~~TRINITY_DN6137_c0_g2_i2.p2  ORF type:complete len:194 (-),score=1.10 TRINITY_DN6137_c0_g2_i2:478-1059(-)